MRPEACLFATSCLPGFAAFPTPDDLPTWRTGPFGEPATLDRAAPLALAWMTALETADVFDNARAIQRICRCNVRPECARRNHGR
ncbi:hypothetical protein [Novosphingobium sp. ERW19]|uniref:hypothetical protein n=1 Tax=Novosphingobium sp. ERW19 TaxID=2726186 RepID=UPI00145777C6|nr:hypothetical protein [Novosphingobium sp. ERW19]NLR41395.1 hypothetical protein [Novosphingobium sp. ERW19]